MGRRRARPKREWIGAFIPTKLAHNLANWNMSGRLDLLHRRNDQATVAGRCRIRAPAAYAFWTHR
jgi:hypothetical protein